VKNKAISEQAELYAYRLVMEHAPDSDELSRELASRLIAIAWLEGNKAGVEWSLTPMGSR
jgi:hypothetical protein